MLYLVYGKNKLLVYIISGISCCAKLEGILDVIRGKEGDNCPCYIVQKYIGKFEFIDHYLFKLVNSKLRISFARFRCV